MAQPVRKTAINVRNAGCIRAPLKTRILAPGVRPLGGFEQYEALGEGDLALPDLLQLPELGTLQGYVAHEGARAAVDEGELFVASAQEPQDRGVRHERLAHGFHAAPVEDAQRISKEEDGARVDGSRGDVVQCPRRVPPHRVEL